MKDFAELKELVNVWGEDKGIFDKSFPLAQLSKTQEELDETKLALTDLAEAGAISETAMDEVVDGIGDMLVTIIILSKMLDLEPETCLSAAYDEIKGRKGKMIDGMFVKDKA